MRTLRAPRASLCLSLLLAASLCGPTGLSAEDGRHGDGHEKWHASFYQQLTIPGTKTSCCNLTDCRPTKIRANGDHYDIMKDGRWIRVDPAKIVKKPAPDGGAHICAPDSTNRGFEPDYVFCIVMPFES